MNRSRLVATAALPLVRFAAAVAVGLFAATATALRLGITASPAAAALVAAGIGRNRARRQRDSRGAGEIFQHSGYSFTTRTLGISKRSGNARAQQTERPDRSGRPTWLIG